MIRVLHASLCSFRVRCGEFDMLLMPILTMIAQASAPSSVVVLPSAQNVQIVAKSCRVASGSLSGQGAVLPPAVDGRRIRTFAQVAALRKATPAGQFVVIEGGDLSRQRVGAVDLSAVCFRGTRLVNTIWTGTKGLGIGFINVDLSGARFDKVVFDSILFRNSTLANVNASGARFAFGQLDGGWNTSLADLNLDNAQMIGFRFICGVTASDGCAFDRKRITMRGTDLSGASLTSFSFWDAVFDGTKLNQTEIGLDQVTQFSGASISGPIIVRSGYKTVNFTPSDFYELRSKLASATDECASPSTPLLKLVCASQPADMLRLHRDIEVLYRGSVADGVKPPAAQQSYLAALEGCVTLPETEASNCARKEMSERRDNLIVEMLRAQPLEKGSRALYVSNDTPFVAASALNPALAPLLAASTSSYMLVRKDKARVLNIRASASDATGNKCAVFDSTKDKPANALVLRIWAKGADFKVNMTDRQNSADRSNQCTANTQSGPLIRIPISDADFDQLWTSTENG
jgi:uncharacterized protein YjbI with pentapeptide repeats